MPSLEERLQRHMREDTHITHPPSDQLGAEPMSDTASRPIEPGTDSWPDLVIDMSTMLFDIGGATVEWRAFENRRVDLVRSDDRGELTTAHLISGDGETMRFVIEVPAASWIAAGKPSDVAVRRV